MTIQPTPPPNDVPRNLEDLLRAVSTAGLCNQRQARECQSAIRSLGKWLGRPLSLIPTDPAALRRHFATLNPTTLHVRPARVANVKSLVAKALDLAGVRPSNRPVAEALTPAWQHLFMQLSGDRYLTSSLAPFARFCAQSGIEPVAVSDETTAKYLDHLERTALVKRPRTVHQTLCRTWNMARAKLRGWPAISLAVPSYAETFSLELAAFPASFNADLEAYLAQLSCDDPVDLLDEAAPPRPLRPNSIKTKRYQIRVFASALVLTGVPIESITSLAVLTRPENFKRGLRFMLDRPREDLGSTRSAGFFAHTIRSIAKYRLRAPEAELALIGTITARLSHHEPGMTDKNRGRLAQFEDRAVLQQFLDLPSIEIDRLRRKGSLTRNDAVRFSILVALEILLHAPGWVRRARRSCSGRIPRLAG